MNPYKSGELLQNTRGVIINIMAPLRQYKPMSALYSRLKIRPYFIKDYEALLGDINLTRYKMILISLHPTSISLPET